jgi:hypothetical protein
MIPIGTSDSHSKLLHKSDPAEKKSLFVASAIPRRSLLAA